MNHLRTSARHAAWQAVRAASPPANWDLVNTRTKTFPAAGWRHEYWFELVVTQNKPLLWVGQFGLDQPYDHATIRHGVRKIAFLRSELNDTASLEIIRRYFRARLDCQPKPPQTHPHELLAINHN